MSPYREGVEARRAEEAQDANPHTPEACGGVLYREWDRGWREAGPNR